MFDFLHSDDLTVQHMAEHAVLNGLNDDEKELLFQLDQKKPHVLTHADSLIEKGLVTSDGLYQVTVIGKRVAQHANH